MYEYGKNIIKQSNLCDSNTAQHVTVIMTCNYNKNKFKHYRNCWLPLMIQPPIYFVSSEIWRLTIWYFFCRNKLFMKNMQYIHIVFIGNIKVNWYEMFKGFWSFEHCSIGNRTTNQIHALNEAMITHIDDHSITYWKRQPTHKPLHLQTQPTSLPKKQK